MRRANHFVSRAVVDFGKTAIVGCDDATMMSAMRGMAQAMAFYRLMQSAFSSDGLNVGDTVSNFERSATLPVDMLSGVLEESVGPMLQRLRLEVAPVLLRSKDMKAFAALLLEYKERFQRRITDVKIEQTALEGRLLERLGDETSEQRCLNMALHFFIGVERVPEGYLVRNDQGLLERHADAKVDPKAPFVHYNDVPHSLLYNFWYRRHIEGNAWIAATALRRLMTAN